MSRADPAPQDHPGKIPALPTSWPPTATPLARGTRAWAGPSCRSCRPSARWLLSTIGFDDILLNAVAGGGSLLSFPVLIATGLSPLTANVTNAVAQMPGYLSIVEVRTESTGYPSERAPSRVAVRRMARTFS